MGGVTVTQILIFFACVGALGVVCYILAKVVPKRKPDDPENPFIIYAREQRKKREEEKRRKEEELKELRELREELKRLRELREKGE